MNDYSELKRLAEQNIRLQDGWYEHRDVMKNNRGDCRLAVSDAIDTDFVIAASPASILALIAENETLTLGVSEFRRFFLDATDQCSKAKRELDSVKAESESLKNEVKELHRKIGGSATHPDKGHGHVYQRDDGVRMRCGGPGICKECSADKARKDASQ